jgi:hypothetical protein
MLQPPKQPPERPQHHHRQKPELGMRSCQALAAHEDAGERDVKDYDTRDDGCQRDPREVGLSGALRAKETGRACTAAGLQVVRAAGGVRPGGTQEARAVHRVAARAAACAAVASAEGNGRRRRSRLRGRRMG